MLLSCIFTVYNSACVIFQQVLVVYWEIFLWKQNPHRFSTQYLENMCVPIIVYCNFPYASLSVIWQTYFWLNIYFACLIGAVRKVGPSVKFISLNIFSQWQFVLRNNLTSSLDVWSDFLIMFHQSSDLTNNIMNVCN